MASGWWYTYPSEKYDFVSWDHDIPNIWKNHPNVPNHQPGLYLAKYDEASGCNIYILILKLHYSDHQNLLTSVGTPRRWRLFFHILRIQNGILAGNSVLQVKLLECNAHECNANKCNTSTEILTAYLTQARQRFEFWDIYHRFSDSYNSSSANPNLNVSGPSLRSLPHLM